MTDEKKKDIFFVIYIIAALVLAVIYFSVPERKEFMEFHMKWWEELRRVW